MPSDDAPVGGLFKVASALEAEPGPVFINEYEESPPEVSETRRLMARIMMAGVEVLHGGNDVRH
jgi:hypothetical protein